MIPGRARSVFLHCRMNGFYTLSDQITNQLRVWGVYLRQSYNFAMGRVGFKLTFGG